MLATAAPAIVAEHALVEVADPDRAAHGRADAAHAVADAGLERTSVSSRILCSSSLGLAHAITASPCGLIENEMAWSVGRGAVTLRTWGISIERVSAASPIPTVYGLTVNSTGSKHSPAKKPEPGPSADESSASRPSCEARMQAEMV